LGRRILKGKICEERRWDRRIVVVAMPQFLGVRKDNVSKNTKDFKHCDL
jgi:hypothetical protein